MLANDWEASSTWNDFGCRRETISGNFDIHNILVTHQILDPKLGGGTLLDLGHCSLVWAIMALYEGPVNGATNPTITGSILKTPMTGVDCNTSFTLNFSQSNLAAQAVLSCSINIDDLDPDLTIQ
ncbi:hypothetical protein C8R41DRAFT_915974 [Lentinula lateritia]|uniref:Uncharacterized protein n=1 Tax=Lentinula lateritia TaxID=40482 RepID=A0ABQ8VTD8_9AGAR|nr:hypothetical protein C8R41DRAFT_915974 [Lentinula lateritia]